MMKKILIVDDEPNILISLEFLLQRAGYRVSLATDGQAAVQAVRNAGPNPDRQKIRDELAKLNKVPVVIGTGTWSLDEKRNPIYGGVLLQVKEGNFVGVQ